MKLKLTIAITCIYLAMATISTIIGCGPSITRQIIVDGHTVTVDHSTSDKAFDALGEAAISANRAHSEAMSDATKASAASAASAKNDVRKAIVALEIAYKEDERLTTEAIRTNDLNALKKVGVILDKYHDRMHAIVNGNPDGDTALSAAEWYRDQLQGKSISDLVSEWPDSKSIASNDEEMPDDCRDKKD